MEIINKNGYYYLRHSYRKGKTVATKEKYLGKEIPKDLERIKKILLIESKKELYEKLHRIKNVYNREWKTYPPSVKKEHLINIAIDFTYNTNAIEGSPITKEETADIIKRKLAPHRPLADIQETINHAKTFFGMLREKRDLSLSLILRWHNEAFQETKPDIAGKLREYNVRVGDYICPDWQDVKTLMQQFTEEYIKNKDKEHPVDLAARMHYRFVAIHPFGDGNGRIGRLIMNFILQKHQFPFMIITYKNRGSYYKALRWANKKGDYEFVKYFVRRYISEYKQYLK